MLPPMPPAAPAFAEAARHLVEELPAGNLTRRLLVVLLAHGLGRRSALRREDLLAHLAAAPGATVGDAAGVANVIASLEDGPVALGRLSGEPARYFLIEEREDALCARAERGKLLDGYRAEQARLARWMEKLGK